MPVVPIYTENDTAEAYQLNWSVSLFARTKLPDLANFYVPLQEVTEGDGVRILELVSSNERCVQFLVSTQPCSSPSNIIQAIKGRLQYLIRELDPKAFARNYFISSVGEANCNTLERYVGKQAMRHRMADSVVQSYMENCQFHDNRFDLAQPRISRHGQFLHSLHLVLENDGGWNKIRPEVLQLTLAKIQAIANKKGWLLSRIGLVANHLHILLGADVTESPRGVVLSLMNNLAYAFGMKRIYRPSFYVGTFGSYDRDAIRRKLDLSTATSTNSATDSLPRQCSRSDLSEVTDN